MKDGNVPFSKHASTCLCTDTRNHTAGGRVTSTFLSLLPPQGKSIKTNDAVIILLACKMHLKITVTFTVIGHLLERYFQDFLEINWRIICLLFKIKYTRTIFKCSLFFDACGSIPLLI